MSKRNNAKTEALLPCLLQVAAADTVPLLLRSLRKQWKRYRKGLKECQKEFSEPAVHHSRVETRRLLSMLELLSPFLAASQLDRARRALKRHLDTFHDLRDTHVQLLSLKPLRKRYAAVAEFEAYLQKREKRFTRRTQRAVKRIKTRRLGKCVDLWREDITALCAGASAVKAHSLVLNGLRTAFGKTALLKSRINPVETRTIHRTRVAFKKFRYMVEIFVCLRPGSPKTLLSAMHSYQTLMGDIQDAEVLLAAYDKFLSKQKQGSEATALLRAELLRNRQSLIELYLANSDTLFDFNPDLPGQGADRGKLPARAEPGGGPSAPPEISFITAGL